MINLWLSNRVMELKCEIMLVLLRIPAIKRALIKKYNATVFPDVVKERYNIYLGETLMLNTHASNLKEAEQIMAIMCAAQEIGR